MARMLSPHTARGRLWWTVRLQQLQPPFDAPDPGPDPEPPVFARRATLATDTTAHDGHSLTDAYVHTGPWPGAYRLMRNSIMAPDSFGGDEDFLVMKSTIPGSPIYWRLGYQIDNSYHPEQRSVFNTNRAPYKEVTVTEAGAPFRVGYVPDEEKRNMTLRYLIEFCEQALAEGDGGNGARINLWSIWPQIDGWVGHPEFGSSWGVLGGFEQCLPEYGRTFKYMADYANWKMRQLHPDLPEDWHIYLFPGHLWWARIVQDLATGSVPGFTTLAEMMHPSDSDTPPNMPIHPGHVAGYGLAALALTCHYQVNLTEQDGVYIQEAYVESRPDPEEDISWPAVSPEFAAYCWQIAWEIATAYGPAGMGGTAGMELVFDGDVDEDPLDGDEPPVDPDETPVDIMGAASRAFMQGGVWQPGYDPGMTVQAGSAASVLQDGYREYRGSVEAAPMAATGARYGVAVLRLDSVLPGVTQVTTAWVNDLTTSWLAPRVELVINNFTTSWTVGEGTAAAQSPYAIGEWQVVEFWLDASEWHVCVDGGPTQSLAREGAVPDTTHLMLGGGTSFGSPDNPVDVDIASMFLCDGIPTAEQRLGIIAWALSQVPAA